MKFARGLHHNHHNSSHAKINNNISLPAPLNNDILIVLQQRHCPVLPLASLTTDGPLSIRHLCANSARHLLYHVHWPLRTTTTSCINEVKFPKMLVRYTQVIGEFSAEDFQSLTIRGKMKRQIYCAQGNLE